MDYTTYTNVNKGLNDRQRQERLIKRLTETHSKPVFQLSRNAKQYTPEHGS